MNSTRSSFLAVFASFLFLFSSVAILEAPVQGASSQAQSISCVSNGIFSAAVDNSSGIFTFSRGACSDSNQPKNFILFPLGTSFSTVADFTDGAVYTEGGGGGGKDLGPPAFSDVVRNSIITGFDLTPEGLEVTQNITVTGTNSTDSSILLNLKVVNHNASPQKVGIRMLWDPQVGGFDGTWLRQYDESVAGRIVGNETDFNPPQASFTSYGLGGCSRKPTSAQAYTCDPSDFGTNSGTGVVFGSISTGRGATPPSRFVYGWWYAMTKTAYAYSSNPANVIGSYGPNVGGRLDSGILYYFSNQTLRSSGGGMVSQADIIGSPGATAATPVSLSVNPPVGPAGTLVTVSASGLKPFSELTMTAFGDLGPLPLHGSCESDGSGAITPIDSCTFVIPPTSEFTTQSISFTEGVHDLIATFTVLSPGGTTGPSSLTLACAPSRVIVGKWTTCKAVVQGTGPPTGSVSWNSNSSGKFSSTSCRLSRQGASSGCSVRFTGVVGGNNAELTAQYTGDSKNLPSSGNFVVQVALVTSTTSVSCKPASAASSSTLITCTVRVTGSKPTGIVAFSQSGSGTVQFVAASCTLSRAIGSEGSKSSILISSTLQGSPVGLCHVTIRGSSPGMVSISASYGGDSSNSAGSGSTTVTVRTATTSLSISCDSMTLGRSNSESCKAVVVGGYSPTGTLTWSIISGNSKAELSSNACVLGSGTCSVTIKGVDVGVVKLRVSYPGDLQNLQCVTYFSLKVI